MNLKKNKIINITLIIYECYLVLLLTFFSAKIIIVMLLVLIILRLIVDFLLTKDVNVIEGEVDYDEKLLKRNYLMDNLSLYLFVFMLQINNIVIGILLIAALRYSSGNDKSQEKIRLATFLIYVIYFGLDDTKIVLLIISIILYYIA